MKWLVLLFAAVLVLSTVSYAQQPSGGKKALKSGEKCEDAAGCVCGNPPIDVKKGCSCQIDSLGGTGTQHCPLGDAGTRPIINDVVWGLIGVVLGAGATFVALRRRTRAV